MAKFQFLFEEYNNFNKIQRFYIFLNLIKYDLLITSVLFFEEVPNFEIILFTYFEIYELFFILIQDPFIKKNKIAYYFIQQLNFNYVKYPILLLKYN